MSNSSWLATAQAGTFDIDLTMADIMCDLDPGWQHASQWYAEEETAPAAPAAVA